MDSSATGLSPSFTNNSSVDSAAQQVQQQQQQQQQLQGQLPFEFPGEYSDPMFNAMAAGVDMSSAAGVGLGGGMLEERRLSGYDFQTMQPLEDFTSLPEWFFPSMNGPPPVQDFDMSFFDTDNVINFAGS
jgi:hypothetical protein